MVTVGDVIDVLDAAYPSQFAQSWDAVGLVCGDPAEAVKKVLVCVDPTESIVQEALLLEAQLVVAHHPLLLDGVHGVPANDVKGRLVHRLIRAGSALFCAHTNADTANPGVSDALAQALGLTVISPLDYRQVDPTDKIIVSVPVGQEQRLIDALAAAGAGWIGNYSHCAFAVEGTGQFVAHSGAQPTVGHVNERTQVAEAQIEMRLPRHRRRAVVAALRQAHPYEEPAFDVIELAAIPDGFGLGRIGKLPEAEPLSAFMQRVADALPATAWGVRGAGTPHRPIRTVAVCGGSGGSLLDQATAAGVDAYLTADLRHHSAADHQATQSLLGKATPALVDVAHWASEWPWCGQAADVIRTALHDTVEVVVSRRRTDPWTLHTHQNSVREQWE